MLRNITIPKKLKPVLLLLSIGFSAYQVAIVVPNMLTVSLGTWVNTIASVVPGIVIVTLIILWNPSHQIHLKHLNLFQFISSFSLRSILLLLPFCIIIGLLTSWSIYNYDLSNMVGQGIVFGSMILMLVIGLIKPELGPALFFVLYSFLMFSEARVFAWAWLVEKIQNTPEWLETTLFGFSNIDIAMLVFTMGFLLFLIRHAQQIGKTMLDKPIMIFLVWTAVSVITASDPLEGLRSYFVEWIFPIIMYYATFLAMKRRNGVREIKIALVALFFFSCLLSIQHALLFKEEITSMGTERAKVWTVIGGQMGPWTILILPLTVSLLFNRKEPMYIRTFSVLTIILALIMAVWEMQRAVILDFFVMLVLNSIFYHHKRWRLLIMYIVLGTVIFLSFEKIKSVIEIVRPGMLEGNLFVPSANLPRLYLWEKALDIIKDKTWLGIGPGGFAPLKLGLHTPTTSSHNLFLEVALESGIIASCLYTMIILSPIVKFVTPFIKGAYRVYDQDLRPWVISLFIFCCIHHQTHANWNWGYGLVVFCMLGVVVGTMRNAERQAQSV